MFMSAVLFAAALQAAPEIGLKGLRPSDRALSVGELSVAPRTRGSSLLHRSPAQLPFTAQSRGPFRIAPKPPKKGFVYNPQMANCRSAAPELAGRPERLQAQPLSKMPEARGERAVARLVDGCPVAVLIHPGSVER